MLFTYIYAPLHPCRLVFHFSTVLVRAFSKDFIFFLLEGPISLKFKQIPTHHKVNACVSHVPLCEAKEFCQPLYNDMISSASCATG